MKFPIVDKVFGHPKVILEIRGNSAGVVEQGYSFRQSRCHSPASATDLPRPLPSSAARSAVQLRS